MSTVKIPPVLRPSTGGEREVSAGGSNVGEVLRSLASEYPDTESQLFGDDGSLNRYVNVYLNDEDVRVLEGLDTGVGETDTLVILPAMAGGGYPPRWPPRATRSSASARSTSTSSPCVSDGAPGSRTSPSPRTSARAGTARRSSTR